MPFSIEEAIWNLQLTNLEFVTRSKTAYTFWKIDDLQLKYQEGATDIYTQNPTAEKAVRLSEEVTITCISNCFRALDTALVLIGLSNGFTWLVDTRTNNLLCQLKLLDSELSFISVNYKRICLHSSNTSELICWSLPEDRNIVAQQFNIFQGTPKTLLLDSPVTAFHFNESTCSGFSATRAGSLWFSDWDENTTLKVNSFHTKSPISKFSVKHGTPSSFKLHDGTVGEEIDKMYYLTSSS